MRGRRGARSIVALAVAAVLAGVLPRPAGAALTLADLRGHLTLGFSHLSSSDTTSTPGGSLSFGGGLDVPIASRLRAGLDIGYHLLGSRTLVEGSLTSGIDYSVFEALGLLHWSPLDRGPELVISGGPGLFSVKAELAATSVGLVFAPRAIDQTRPGAALSVGLYRRRPTPVRVGFELGARYIPLAHDVRWTLASARIALLY